MKKALVDTIRNQFEQDKDSFLRRNVKYVMYDGMPLEEGQEQKVDETVSHFQKCVEKIISEIEKRQSIPNSLEVKTVDETLSVSLFIPDFEDEISILYFMEHPFKGIEWNLNSINLCEE